jgi:hypothetical protein
MLNQLNHKAKFTASVAIVLLLSSLAMIAIQFQHVNAQLSDSQPTVEIPIGITPDHTLETIAYLSFRPRPVGLDQPFLVNAWISTETLFRHLAFIDSYRVTITKPDGTEDIITMSTYPADGTTWFEYIADQVGKWTIKLDFLGNYFPPGQYYEGHIVTNSSGQALDSSYYYMPSSDGPYELVVQEDIVLSWPEAPLPTDYWTRPVHPQLREWWSILGNYPGTGVVGGGPYWPANTNTYIVPQYNFVPYAQGPLSAHLVWKRQISLGGLVGSTMGQTTFYYPPQLYGQIPTIIYAGRGYQTLTKEVNGELQDVWQCYDIRTGEVYWELLGAAQRPTFIHYEFGSEFVAGSQGFERRIHLGYVGNGRLIKYDPWNGAVVGNYSISPVTTGTFYADPYVLSVQDLGSSVPPEERYRLINWTVRGTSSDFTTRVINNCSWPLSNLPSTVDFEAGIVVNAARGSTRIQTYSLTTGNLIVDFDTEITYPSSGTPTLVDHGKVARHYTEGHWHCWDIYTGQKLWISEISSWPWGTWGTYNTASWGGMIFHHSYDGLSAINWTDGKILWTYVCSTVPYESPFTGPDGQTVHAWHGGGGMIADGVYYAMNSEHSPDQPIKRGWKMHAINATTGEGIWMLAAGQTGGGSGSRAFQGAIADGYLAYDDMYTGIMYVVGKGRSTTTVTAPDVAVPKGTAMMIKGQVLDLSPAQSGTPCVSKESMMLQMEHLHMQMPIDGIWHNETITGVPVVLSAIAEDGSYVDIGTVTTDGYSGTFGKAWTPTTEGTYKIVASFAGDESYGSSDAATYVSVGPAPAAGGEVEPEPEPEPEPTPLISTELAIAIAVIAAVVIGIVAFVLLRKRE